MDLLSEVSTHLLEQNPYVPGFQPDGPGWVKLNTNENAYLPSPKVSEAIQRASSRLALYPDPNCVELRTTIAEIHNVKLEEVVVGNGSDELLALLTRVFCGENKTALMTDPSYSHYPVLIEIANGSVKKIPLGDAMSLDVDSLIDEESQILFLTTPNAPTGKGFSNEELGRLAKGYKGVLVLDEAYCAFAEENGLKVFHENENVIILRTFSKSHALAGLRVGYMLAHESIIKIINAIRDPYNVGTVAQVGALAALKDDRYYDDTLSKIKNTRDRIQDVFAGWGWEYFKSSTNFIFVQPQTAEGASGKGVAESLYNHLFEEKILVRYFGKYKETESFLRITVGTDDQMNLLIGSIETWLKKEK